MPLLDDGRRRTQRVVQLFLTGAVALLPLAFTAAIVGWLVKLVHDLVGPASFCGQAFRSIGMSVVACEVTAYTLGLVSVIVLVYLLGVLIDSGAAARWQRVMDSAMCRVPVLGTVYDASRQVTSMFDRKPDARPNMTPVMCYFGNNRDMGVPALMPTPEVVRYGDNEYHVVIIPTAPVPFGGALVCVKADWIDRAECSFEDLVGVYVSMGVTAPRSLGNGGSGNATPDAPT